MKNVFLTAALFGMLFTSCSTGGEHAEEVAEATEEMVEEVVATAGAYAIDNNASVLGWKAYKLVGGHNGTVDFSNGQLNVENGQLVGGEFTLDLNTISVSDIPAEAEENGKLVGHLKHEDFFGVETNPTSNFVITSATPMEAADANGNNYNIVGDLTIKGITHEVSFPATVNIAAGEIETTASFDIDRTQWDIKYNSKNFFQDIADDYLIKDNVTFEVNMVASPAGA